MHLFHRVDTELSNQDWHSVFARFARCRILVVAAQALTFVEARGTVVTRIRRLVHPVPTARAGYMRTKGAYRSLWHATHEARPLDLDLWAWELVPRR